MILLVVGARNRRQLTGRYTTLGVPTVPDRLLFAVAAATRAGRRAAVAVGADVAVVAAVAALILALAFLARARQHLRRSCLPGGCC